MTIDQTHALIAHGDFGDAEHPPSFELLWVDLRAGREHGGACMAAAKEWSGRDDLWSVAQLEVPVEAELGNDSDGTEIAGPTTSTSTLEVEGGGSPNIGQLEIESVLPIIAPTPSTPPVPDDNGDSCIDGTCPSCWDSPEVEGVVSGVASEVQVAVASTPSTPPVPSDDAAAVVGDAFPAVLYASKDITDAEAKAIKNAWHTDRLALVDARSALNATPDQGADLSEGFDELWAKMKAEFDALDSAARSWRGEMVSEAMRRNVPFHVQQVRTERTYHLNRGLIALCTAGGDQDELLRALLALVVGDVALFVGIAPGHVLGSLGATEAAAFATLVDAYVGDRLIAYTDESGALRYRAA